MSDVDKFMTDFMKDAAKNFTKAGIYFTSQLRTELNVAQPYKRSSGGRYRGLNPSRPGGYPHKLSGQLQKSITWKLDNKTMTLEVGSNLKPYPAMLESGTRYMKPRPWLSLGWEQNKLKVIQIATGG